MICGLDQLDDFSKAGIAAGVNGLLLAVGVWVSHMHVFNIPESENRPWLDCLLLDRLICIGISVSVTASVLGIGLVFIYANGTGGCKGIGGISIQNIWFTCDNFGMWMTVLEAYVVTVILCYNLDFEATLLLQANKEYLQSFESGGASNVLLDQLAPELHDTAILRDYLLNELGDHAVCQLHHRQGNEVAYVNLHTYRSVLRAHNLELCKVTFVPEPQNVIWQNFGPSGRLRQVIVDVVLASFVVWWAVPVSLLKAISEYSKWELLLRLPHYSKNATVFLNFIPTILLDTMLCLLYMLFRWLAEVIERRRLRSEVDAVVSARYYMFYTTTIYATVLSGSVWSSLADVFASPEEFLSNMAMTFTDVGLFFTNSMFGLIGLLGVFNITAHVPLVRYYIHGERFAFPFDQVVPNLQYGFLILMIYAVLCPLIGWVSLLYFMCARWVYGKSVRLHPHESPSSACVFHVALQQCVFAALLGSIVLCGVVLVHASCALCVNCWVMVLAVVSLPIGILFFRRRLRERLRHSRLSLEVANSLDKMKSERPSSVEPTTFREATIELPTPLLRSNNDPF